MEKSTLKPMKKIKKASLNISRAGKVDRPLQRDVSVRVTRGGGRRGSSTASLICAAKPDQTRPQYQHASL